jgi:hypothetical protein
MRREMLTEGYAFPNGRDVDWSRSALCSAGDFQDSN